MRTGLVVLLLTACATTSQGPATHDTDDTDAPDTPTPTDTPGDSDVETDVARHTDAETDTDRGGATDRPTETDPVDTDPLDTPLPDADGDGTPDATDCAPNDATVHPGAVETCNGVDDDCDHLVDDDDPDRVVTDPWGDDDDHDGYPRDAYTYWTCTPHRPNPIRYGAAAPDCDDTDAAIHPGATEVCNSVDDD